MKKIAFFVEGQTEQIFVNRLVKEIIGSSNVTVIQKKISGGTNAPKREFVRSYSISRKPTFTALIYDCGSDNRVKSEILDNIKSLRESGYNCIVGLRDLYPLPIDELPRLEKGLKFLPYSLRELNNPFDIVIAVREVETWFLAETSHFMKIDKRLTGRFIERHLGFDPYNIDPVSREHPSEDLNRIYKLVGKSYTKKHWQVEKLVSRLDFNKIRRDLRPKIPALNTLITTIESVKKAKLVHQPTTNI
ncbi:DUF4276 family protein [Dysgonomonas macrotermitis]|uniref:DUF4276 family protein n=1 Tax=Dysgonomonas macrotermitis TaxID=1346286 RepID=A0A1M5DVY0_9BACT|nr:DUF4276 family protein [Dysgonomonas macrotermitis]SHF70982.1 protein of unknown function [Dysgonomonas macrotermitis]